MGHLRSTVIGDAIKRGAPVFEERESERKVRENGRAPVVGFASSQALANVLELRGHDAPRRVLPMCPLWSPWRVFRDATRDQPTPTLKIKRNNSGAASQPRRRLGDPVRHAHRAPRRRLPRHGVSHTLRFGPPA